VVEDVAGLMDASDTLRGGKGCKGLSKLSWESAGRKVGRRMFDDEAKKASMSKRHPVREKHTRM